jgi:DNA-binding NarL/FixJ family response regulator
VEALSGRRGEVLGLVAQGLTNAEVTRRLFNSVRAVECRVAALMRRLGLEDRRALSTSAAVSLWGRTYRFWV